MVMNLGRLLRHLSLPGWVVRRRFSEAVLSRVEHAIHGSEAQHRGEIGVAIEGGLGLADLWRGRSPRERALAAFASLGMWDTEENTGVLIYVQYADRAVEIVADRGIDRRVPPAQWAAICRELEAGFARGEHAAALEAAVARIGSLVAAHFPHQPGNPDELPNRPVIL
jgi:hypothetical protein